MLVDSHRQIDICTFGVGFRGGELEKLLQRQSAIAVSRMGRSNLSQPCGVDVSVADRVLVRELVLVLLKQPSLPAAISRVG